MRYFTELLNQGKRLVLTGKYKLDTSSCTLYNYITLLNNMIYEFLVLQGLDMSKRILKKNC